MLSAAALPSSACSCSDASGCQAVASGNVSLSGSVLRDTLTIVGTLPPNPYNSLRGASADSLTCRSGELPCCSALALRILAKGVNSRECALSFTPRSRLSVSLAPAASWVG